MVSGHSQSLQLTCIICIIQVPEGEKKEQEIGNLFEKIMNENFPNLEKEIDMQVQEAQSPKQDGCKEAHFKTYHY